MALSGYFYGTTANARIKPKLSWSAVQSVEGNYSDITVTLSYSRTNTGYKTEGQWAGTIYLGDQQKSGEAQLSISYESNTKALTATFRVYHDDYGQLKVKLWAEGKIYSPADSSLRSTAISGQIQPDDIPRASVATAPNGFVGSRVTVAIAKKSAAFTHSIGYTFGSLSGWLSPEGEAVLQEQRFAAQTINFLLPESFYGEIPDAPSGVCSLTCYTYQDEVLLGQRCCEFTVTADPAICAPVVQVSARDTNPETLALTGREDLFVRYCSHISCTVTAAAQKGAQLISVTAEGVPVTDGVYELEALDRESLTFTATDSRGYTAAVVFSPEMIPYVQLTTNATVRRTDPTGGDAILHLQGSVFSGGFPLVENALAAAWTAGENSDSAVVDIREDDTYEMDILLTGLDYRQSHTVLLAVSDGVMTVRQTLTVQKGLPVFDWGEEDFRFYVPVEVKALTIDGVSLTQYIKNVISET